MLFGIGERPDVLSFFCSTFSSVRSDGPSGTSRIRDKLCMGYGTNRLGRTIIAEKSPKASFFLSDYMCLCAITRKKERKPEQAPTVLCHRKLVQFRLVLRPTFPFRRTRACPVLRRRCRRSRRRQARTANAQPLAFSCSSTSSSSWRQSIESIMSFALCATTT